MQVMTTDQIILISVLALTMVLLVWGRYRFDMVAVAALLSLALMKIIPPAETFAGFGSPAVITVAAVLIISKALNYSGIIGKLSHLLIREKSTPFVQLVIMTCLGAALSAFMNNVGALALLMPVALQLARAGKIPPAMILMPLSFGTILGGLMTMIGTPPNIIIADYRQSIAGAPFAIFDFSPIGVVVAFTGVAFITLFGAKLIPSSRKGKKSPEEIFEINDYIFETRISEDSDLIGIHVRDIEDADEIGFELVGIMRGKERCMGKRRLERMELKAKDILIIKTDSAGLNAVTKTHKLELMGEIALYEDDLNSEDVSLLEAVIAPGARVEGKSFGGLRLRSRYSIALLGIAREGSAFKQRLNKVILRAGDVLLLQGETDNLQETVNRIGCLPLAERGLQFGKRPAAVWPVSIFAVALILTATGMLAVQIAFLMAVLALILIESITLREAYEAIDWSVIVLLGAMIPLGQALQTTGTTEVLTQGLLSLSSDISPILIMGVILIATMTLSDIMNNAATTVVMAPIAVSLATELAVNVDAYLMAVAIGASCAFLTPIGHQNNVLVMGPGGYRFGDYWRLGLPLEILIVIVSIPMICLVWPL
jgi:di/tricarboxylate transporter